MGLWIAVTYLNVLVRIELYQENRRSTRDSKERTFQDVAAYISKHLEIVSREESVCFYQKNNTWLNFAWSYASWAVLQALVVNSIIYLCAMKSIDWHLLSSRIVSLGSIVHNCFIQKAIRIRIPHGEYLSLDHSDFLSFKSQGGVRLGHFNVTLISRGVYKSVWVYWPFLDLVQFSWDIWASLTKMHDDISYH